MQSGKSSHNQGNPPPAERMALLVPAIAGCQIVWVTFWRCRGVSGSIPRSTAKRSTME